jgi:hypothetical protein
MRRALLLGAIVLILAAASMLVAGAAQAAGNCVYCDNYCEWGDEGYYTCYGIEGGCVLAESGCPGVYGEGGGHPGHIRHQLP